MMTDKNSFLNDILARLDMSGYIRSEDIPDIELYMDQVTTLMDTYLGGSKRYEDDKILTKTMINNYSKNHLLPPSNKKKYSREHILLLIFIYYMKNILSIRDIDTLLDPLTSRCLSEDAGVSLKEVYDRIFSAEFSDLESIREDVARKYARTGEVFPDAPEEDREYLRLFSFICALCFDIYEKKQIVERLIDTLPTPDHKKK